jgi:uncharacterized protein (TIGR02996 family)
MPDATPFLAAIRAAPDDDAPRLIYADWLDEHGQPERAEFIRVQCELARHDSPTLRQREAELQAEHHDAFAGALATQGLRFRFARGFPLTFGHTGLFVRRSPGRKGKTRAISLLRFFPDGTLLSLATTDSPTVVDWFREQHPRHVRHVYALAGTDFSGRLQIHSFNWQEGSHYNGQLSAGSIRLNRPNFVGTLHTGKYTRDSIPDFDSFPDSPQDAV